MRSGVRGRLSVMLTSVYIWRRIRLADVLSETSGVQVGWGIRDDGAVRCGAAAAWMQNVLRFRICLINQAFSRGNKELDASIIQMATDGLFSEC